MQKEKHAKIKWALSAAVVVLLLLSSYIFATTSQKNNAHQLHINGTQLQLEIATMSQERARGLCCRESLAPTAGMLFVYDKPGDYRFWMKDTLIPLDMIWLGANKKVVHIEHNIRPESYPATFGSPVAAQYILETNAGWAAQHNITLGDQAAF